MLSEVDNKKFFRKGNRIKAYNLLIISILYIIN